MKRSTANTESKPAKASNFIHHLKKYHKRHPDMIVVIYVRVSTCAQGYRGNFDTYEKVLRRRLKKLNITVVCCYREVSSGWIVDDNEKRVLVKAVKKAIKKKAVIIAASSDRFLRSINFNTVTNPDVLPTEAEFKKLQKLTCGVPLVTLLHPDKPWKKVRSYQSRWGQRAKRKKGGRPIVKRPGYKKRRREKHLPTVGRLLKKGKNPTEIARKLGIARSTVSNWIE